MSPSIHVSPKALRLMRNAIRAAINDSWADAERPEHRPALEQGAKDTLRKLRVYIAELERAQQTLRNTVKGN